MKKLILSVAAFAFATVLFAQKSVSDVAKFETETINQGTLKQNNPKEVRFIVTNISKEPLIIEQANPTCGCTMGDYTKSPIAPGATGFVSAKFNAVAVGHFNKTMTVKFAGIDELKNITITGDVLSGPDYDKWVVENEAKNKTNDLPVKTSAVSKTKGAAQKN
ncbi:MAG: DUF1573 domain-containing protein [Ferruginibacter sp.]